MLNSIPASPAAGVLFAGVDWGNFHHQLCILDPQGEVVYQGKFAHDVAGLHQLSQELRLARPGGRHRDRAGRRPVSRDAARGRAPAVLRVAEDVGPGAGAVPDRTGQVRRVRRVRPGRLAAARAPALACPSTSPAPSTRSRSTCAGPSAPATSTAGSPAATPPPAAATSTTSSIAKTAVGTPSPTSPCSAASTTSSPYTAGAGSSLSIPTAQQQRSAPTAPKHSAATRHPFRPHDRTLAASIRPGAGP